MFNESSTNLANVFKSIRPLSLEICQEIVGYLDRQSKKNLNKAVEGERGNSLTGFNHKEFSSNLDDVETKILRQSRSING